MTDLRCPRCRHLLGRTIGDLLEIRYGRKIHVSIRTGLIRCTQCDLRLRVDSGGIRVLASAETQESLTPSSSTEAAS